MKKVKVTPDYVDSLLELYGDSPIMTGQVGSCLESMMEELELRRRAMGKGCFAAGDCDDCDSKCPVMALERMEWFG